jgi:hypothetical protein
MLNFMSTDQRCSTKTECYTRRMPTLRSRHTLTETDDVAAALDDAALAWPELRGDRGALLRKLIEVGHASVHVDGGVHALISGAAGAVTGAYPRDARSTLLAEWPE